MVARKTRKAYNGVTPCKCGIGEGCVMTVREMVLQDKPVRVGPLAKEAGVSAGTLYNLIRAGEIPVIRIGRSIVVPPHGARPLLGLQKQPEAA